MWLQHPIHLTGRLVRLEPLVDEHIPGLIDAGAHAKIWQNLPFDGTNAVKLNQELHQAILNRVNRTQYPFTVIRQQDDKIIGSTRLFDIFQEHKKLEIGWTWYTPEVWGKGYNIECKLLLLEYCFEQLLANRVQLKTRETNKRSQTAILNIGATFEGTLRKDRIMADGRVLDTLVYSIIREEWPEVKAGLVAKLSA